MDIWTVYDRPSDFPDKFVARKWAFEEPAAEIITAADLDEIREKLASQGFIRIPRFAGDDACIVETWL